jgi:hypothetical protein
MFNIRRLTALQDACVARWHDLPEDSRYEGLRDLVCQQLRCNFLLWHEEDKARCPAASDAQIAHVKRTIDLLNQQRNDATERLDDWIGQQLVRRGVTAPSAAPFNTETLGSTLDRLGILALRIYHLREQMEREDATDEHRERVGHKLYLATVQHDDLSRSAQQLADDLAAGRKRHQTYRQLKMYNDPTLNPYLYQASDRAPLASAPRSV